MNSYATTTLPGTSAAELQLPGHVELALAGITHHAFSIDPTLADTAAFSRAYQWPLDHAANAIVVIGRRSQHTVTAMCVALASTKLDTNKVIRSVLDVRKVSFAPMDAAVAATGMEFGAITPLGAPADWPLLIDARVVQADHIVVGGGRRDAKVVVPGAALGELPGATIVDGLAVVR
ncbi:YbaK/EbsC family protein [Mycolicibacterium sp. S3B2]|uniref:YbaK/EbsC family protein n=1 Tax=Mycolicibacterium sp. S3B2 TaxID=3415120 RepID=UPI003C7CE497